MDITAMYNSIDETTGDPISTAVVENAPISEMRIRHADGNVFIQWDTDNGSHNARLDSTQKMFEGYVVAETTTSDTAVPDAVQTWLQSLGFTTISDEAIALMEHS